MALDGDERRVYFRVGREEAARHLAAVYKAESSFGPRKMGAGPSGIGAMDIHTGAISYVVSVPFQVGHIQTNPWVPGQIVFCWETGGKSPQRTWIVNADGTGLRPLYPEAPYEWVTHEAVIGAEEVAIAIMGHRKIARHGRQCSTGHRGDRRQSRTGSRLGAFGLKRETHGTGHCQYQDQGDDHCRTDRYGQWPLACKRFLRRALCCGG